MKFSWLHYFNKYFLQIFFIRLARVYSKLDLKKQQQLGWTIIFRIPFTGWKK